MGIDKGIIILVLARLMSPLFLKFLQYEDFLAYVIIELSSLHQDFRRASCVLHRVPVTGEFRTELPWSCL